MRIIIIFYVLYSTNENILYVYPISQLRQSEEAREAEMADVNELTTEFTDRLTEAEKRVSNAIRVTHFSN